MKRTKIAARSGAAALLRGEGQKRAGTKPWCRTTAGTRAPQTRDEFRLLGLAGIVGLEHAKRLIDDELARIYSALGSSK